MENFFILLDYISLNIKINFILTIIIFFFFSLLYNAFSIPGNLVFVASAGYFFGIYLGYILCISTIVLGSLIFFLFSKIFFKTYFPKIFNKFSIKVNNYISDSSNEYLIILRMIPGPPLFLQNFCLSILNINIFKFIFTSAIGFTPIIFITVFIGYQFNNIDNIKNISLSDIFSLEFLFFIVLAILILVIRIVYKRKKKTLN